MKAIKKFTAAIVVACTVLCVGCGNTNTNNASNNVASNAVSNENNNTSEDNTADADVATDDEAEEAVADNAEATGEKISSTSVTTIIPEGWSEVPMPEGVDGFNLQNGLFNTVSVIVSDAGSDLESAGLETYLETFKTRFAQSGLEVSLAETRTYAFGEAIVVKGSGEITQELIDANIAAGLATDEQAAAAKALVGKSKNECAVVFIKGTKMIIIDGISLSDDADTVEKAVETISNNLEANA